MVAVFVAGAAIGGTATSLTPGRDADVEAAPGASTSTPADRSEGTDASAVPDARPITIAFVGDINAERSLATRLQASPDEFVGPFADLLLGADLAVGNLEAAIATGGAPAPKEFTFRAPPDILDALEAGGLDVVSLANNHGVDFGTGGLAETLAAKSARGDGMVIGVGNDDDEAYAPFVADVGGHRVAVVAATQVIGSSFIESWTAREDQAGLASAKDVRRLVEEVEAARAAADTVVVFLHWGVETELCPSPVQQELAESLVAAGADVVVGGHAHRVQGGGMLGEAFVGYGLGNFLFGAVSAESAKTGVLLVTVDDRTIVGYEWRPGRIVDRVPVPLEGDAAAAALAEWHDRRACTNLTD